MAEMPRFFGSVPKPVVPGLKFCRFANRQDFTMARSPPAFLCRIAHIPSTVVEISLARSGIHRDLIPKPPQVAPAQACRG
jgi:hypothetical protein